MDVGPARTGNALAELAAELRTLRHGASLTLRELSRLTHVSDSSLSRYFGGQAIPPSTVVVALCEAAGVDPAHLLSLCAQARDAQRQSRWSGPDLRPGSAPADLAFPADIDTGCSDDVDVDVAARRAKRAFKRLGVAVAWVAMMAAAAAGGYAMDDPDVVVMSAPPGTGVPTPGAVPVGVTAPPPVPSAHPSVGRSSIPAPDGRVLPAAFPDDAATTTSAAVATSGAPRRRGARPVRVDGPQPVVGAGTAACVVKPPDTYEEVEYLAADHADWNGRDMAYPAKLHGTVVRLYRGRTLGYAYAVAENAVADDRVSLERVSKPADTGGKTWWRTAELASWEYCEKRIERGEGRAATSALLSRSRAVRVCLHRASGLQCTNVWYSDAA